MKQTIPVPHRYAALIPTETVLMRVGRQGDGGYLLAESAIQLSQALLSLGISNEWSFDEDFLDRCPSAAYVACDRSAGFLVFAASSLRSIFRRSEWWNVRKSAQNALRFLQLVPPTPFTRRRQFVRRWVRHKIVDHQRDTTLECLMNLLSKQSGVFLKMDIEGGEYEILADVVMRESQNSGTFSGLVVEFHDISSRESEFLSLLTKISEYFSVIHTHVNNCSPLRGDFVDVLEISFMPKKLENGSRLFPTGPHRLDYPNDPTMEDVQLDFASLS